MKKILLLGHSGKMGTALSQVLDQDFIVIGKNSTDFAATDSHQVKEMIREEQPWAIVNTVAFLGIDPAEKEPHKAFALNTLYPKVLAQTANEVGSILVHFSTDAVFDDSKQQYYVESDHPAPLNIYGLTKFGGDCQVQALAEKYYLLRLPILFGPTSRQDQFVEKMLTRIKAGQQELKIATDIISTPTYSLDAAQRVKTILQELPPWGLYHVSNTGLASLYELMQAIVQELGLQVKVNPASYRDFPHIGRKNTCTPLATERLVPMRPWEEAVKDYCQQIQS